MNDEHSVLRVEAKVIGKRTPVDTPRYVTLPPAFLSEREDAEPLFLLRHLIEHIVREDVRAFQQRQEERCLLRVLSPQEIHEAARRGKVSVGDEQGNVRTEVDADEAVQVAVQAFEDGIYLVFLDGQLQYDLASPVQLHPTSTLLFVRLVALVGG